MPPTRTIKQKSKKLPGLKLPKCRSTVLVAKLYIPSTPNNSNETHIFIVWAEPTVLGSTKTALKFKYTI